MATPTFGAWSTPDTPSANSVDDTVTRRALSPRHPLVALAVTAVVAAGLVLIPADAAAEEVTPGPLVLTKAEKCVNTGDGDECNVNTPGNNSKGKGCDKGLGDKKGTNGADCTGGDSGSEESGSNDSGSDDSGSDDSGSDESGSNDSGSDDPGSDDPGSDESDSTDPGSNDGTAPPEVLGVVEENEPADGSGAEVLGETEEARGAPDELAFTGPAAAVPMALGGSSFMAAGAAMMLAGRRRRPTEQRQAWWERVAL